MYLQLGCFSVKPREAEQYKVILSYSTWIYCSDIHTYVMTCKRGTQRNDLSSITRTNSLQHYKFNNSYLSNLKNAPLTTLPHKLSTWMHVQYSDNISPSSK